MKARKILIFVALAAVAFFVFALLLPGDKKNAPPAAQEQAATKATPEPAKEAVATAETPGQQAVKAELRALYVEFEGFFKTRAFQKEGWAETPESEKWTERLSTLGAGVHFDPKEVNPDATEAVREAAEYLRRLPWEINDNGGRFAPYMEDNLKAVVAAIKTGPDDTIGADMLQLADKQTAKFKEIPALSDPKAELRALYLDFEGFLKTKTIQDKNWLSSEECTAWSYRLGRLQKAMEDANAPKATRQIVTDLGSLVARLGGKERFDEMSKNDLKSILDRIRTGPDDPIGAGTLQLAIQQVAADNSPFDVKKTVDVQQEIRKFFEELQTLRNDRNFREQGFDYGKAARWLERVEAWQKRVEDDPAIPQQVRLASPSIVLLAHEWEMHRGNMTDEAREYFKELQDAVQWKPDPQQ